MQPQLSLRSYDTNSDTETVAYKGPLRDYFSISPETLRPQNISITRSFSLLLFDIDCDAHHSFNIIINGRLKHLDRRSDGWHLILPLKNDVQYFFVSIFGTTSYLDLVIKVCHYYEIENKETSLCFAKAPLYIFSQWASDWQTIYGAKPTRSPFSETVTNFRAPILPVEKRLFELYGIMIDLLLLIKNTRVEDFADDFSALEATVIDIPNILTAIKNNFALLTPKFGGPINVKGKSYTSAFVSRKLERMNVDLSALRTANSTLVTFLRQFEAPYPLLELIFRLDEVTRLKSVRPARQHDNTSLRTFLFGTLTSSLGRRLKEYYLNSFQIVLSHQSTDDPRSIVRSLLYIKEDYQVFEDLALAGMALAAQYSIADVRRRPSKFSGGRWEIINTNAPGGLQELRKLLKGWRDQSCQPSGYEPDAVLVTSEGRSIIVDTKFRVGRTFNEHGDPSGIQEIQAYMNEFECSDALMIVPLITSSLVGEDHGPTISISGTIRDKQYRIWILEFRGIKDNTFSDAISKIASYRAEAPDGHTL